VGKRDDEVTSPNRMRCENTYMREKCIMKKIVICRKMCAKYGTEASLHKKKNIPWKN
jgi:hypothetical protein